MNASADRPLRGRRGESTLFERQGTQMRIIRSDAGRRLLFLGVLLILAAWAVGGFAVPPERTIRPDLRVAQLSQPAKTGASFQQPERKIAFEMRDKPWIGEKGSVLEW